MIPHFPGFSPLFFSGFTSILTSMTITAANLSAVFSLFLFSHMSVIVRPGFDIGATYHDFPVILDHSGADLGNPDWSSVTKAHLSSFS